MSKLMRALLVPAVAGALYAGPALADPREVLEPNHDQGGSIVRSTWTDGSVPSTIRGRDTDVKYFVDHLSAHQKAGIARSTENERQKKAKDGAPAHTQRIAHPKGGDQTAESASGVASHCSELKRCKKDGEKLHFSANQQQQLSGGSEKPADTGASSGAHPPAGASQPTSKSEDKRVVAHHESEKFKAPVKLVNEGKPDMGESDTRASRSAPEARAERFVSLHEPGSMAAHHVDRAVQLRMPDKFFH